MINQISSIVLFGIVFALTIEEKKRFSSIITPFTVTAWPFAIISVIVNFIGIYMQFPPVTLRANMLILLNLIILWVIGYFLSVFYYKPEKKQNYFEIFYDFERYKNLILFISLVCAGAIIIRLYFIASEFGWWFVASDEFERMIIVGVTAHLAQVAKVCFILLFLIMPHTKNKWLVYVALIFIFISILALRVKYHAMWIIMMIFFIKYLPYDARTQFKKILNVFGILAAIFFVNYVSMFIAFDAFNIKSENMWSFFFKQFMNYLVTGPIILDYWIDMSGIKPGWALFIVFINFKNLLLGKLEMMNAVHYVSNGFIETAPGLYSNVGTSYGVYYLIGGFWFTLFMTSVVSIISYLIYVKSISSKSKILLYLNIVFLTMGTLSFFVQYFTLLSLYEMTAIYIIFVFTFSFLNKIGFWKVERTI